LVAVLQNGELTLDQVKPSYAIIDAFHHKKVPGYDVRGFDNLIVIARDAKQLQEEQDLYDLNVSSYLKLQRSGEQLGYLKSCWDMVGTVMYTFTDWYKTLWDRIDVEFLSEETKKLQKDIKQLNKAVRNFEVYRLMEEKLRAMSTSLPLVGDLAHPAMRDRHWEQLMKATGKTFVKDDKFSLGDLLNLGLHNYVDDCSEIVDRAQKVWTGPSLASTRELLA
jgi:dynein heavy chain, axonemal